jgi:enoyl-CoA hydratase/carnithine racemase
MSTWTNVTRAAPDLAQRVQARFEASGLGLIATLRADGAPRISGVEAFFGLGELWLGMMPGSVKARDLQHDPRFALHAATADKHVTHGDAKVAGVAEEVTDADRRAAYQRAFAEHTGFDPGATGAYHLFRLDVLEMVHVSLAPEGDALLIERWSPGQPVTTVRR